MASIAFLGLGQMGLPMARRLLDAGHELTVWNRTPGRAGPLLVAGAKEVPSPAEAASVADIVITMLSTPEALDEVFATLRPALSNKSWLEMSTVGPNAARSLAQRLPEGVRMLDAPVLGSVPQATDGSLRIFVGGEEDAFGDVQPILDVMGDPVYLGPLGAGAAMKLVANSTLGGITVVLGEALALAAALGVDRGRALDLLPPPMRVVVDRARESITSGRYPPAFKLSLAAKDMRLVDEAAEAAGLDLKAARAVRAWLDEAAQTESAQLNYSAVIAYILGEDASA